MKQCQYCDSKKNVTTWVPGGNICNDCHKNLMTIRKLKLGIPKSNYHAGSFTWKDKEVD